MSFAIVVDAVHDEREIRLRRIHAVRLHDRVGICECRRLRRRDQQDLICRKDEVHDILAESRPCIDEDDVREFSRLHELYEELSLLCAVERLRFLDA